MSSAIYNIKVKLEPALTALTLKVRSSLFGHCFQRVVTDIQVAVNINIM